ncbi:MAG TPA: hypothetical protein VHW24_21970 [Bryobacteraceae bacterium]|jgi:predicted Fe-S protein YdhL (DUF1289 family)|nr:hypothetical protein [Bryobacteraceae bacterium]
MSFRALCFSGVAIALATTGALATDNAGSRPGHPAVESGAYRHHHGLRLAKELKMMWRQEERAHMKALPKDQRRGWLKAKWLAMTDQQKQAKTVELQAKWNRLPASVRENLLDKKRQKREAKLMQRSEPDKQSAQPQQR